ncbi:MAG TPA: AmmeMemoRadiSam system protein A [Gammaproteobacteria bacterium]|nr:AmmeMemoRadiSam system protein A [Gammaproteobacteria bacterium]HKV97015.1 AmmeMemoRadiSam system protein A [Gammaproteobacteria bacterium]
MPLSALTRITLLDAARHSIRQSLDDQPAAFSHQNGDPVLRAVRASFVTLKRRGTLRGCIGNLDAKQELLADVMQNAQLAACHDPRFPPLLAAEFEDLHIEISVLSGTEPVAARNRDELLQALRPGTDGVIVQEGERRATFLPAVWASLSDPREFYAQLMCKAGLGAAHWSPTLRFSRYQTESFGKGEPS